MMQACRNNAVAKSDLRRFAILILLALLFTPHSVLFAAEKEAGKVVSVAGRAAAATLDGDIRNLGSGGKVNTGDTVVTSRNSYVRLKLLDGASVILRPNSRFQIEDYNVAENEQENRSVLVLQPHLRHLKGLVWRLLRPSGVSKIPEFWDFCRK